ncbi:hypothetical protein E8E13_005221 [Curvularia kusanoi]|uniref:Rhodopsin domain-containing protein n=1 Tax=Curvularia kusanoi TaxID=90978 RepID=A0A9P4WA90_CURKU|nr:hypothetical protein E8E13_005221 [Curvularia kusanoi]
MVLGVTWWLTFFCGGFLGIRVYAKISRRQGLWWDDWILIVSWLFLLAEAIVSQMAVSLGAGKHVVDVKPENLTSIALIFSIGVSISCFSSTLSKISFGVTLLRLTSGKIRWSVWFSIVTLFLFMLPSAFIVWIQCTPTAKAWNPSLPGHCWDPAATVNYGIFNAAWCVVADFYLALLPWTLIMGLQMRTREKIGVGIAMSMGLFAGVCAIVKGIYLMQVKEADFSYNGKDVVIWTAVETAVAIIGASIPVLRVFFREKVSSYSGSRGRSNGGRSNAPSTLKHINTSVAASAARASIALNAMGPTKDGAWTRIEPIEERGLRERESDEEIGVAVSGEQRLQQKIWQTTTITHEVESIESGSSDRSERNLKRPDWHS